MSITIQVGVDIVGQPNYITIPNHCVEVVKPEIKVGKVSGSLGNKPEIVRTQHK